MAKEKYKLQMFIEQKGLCYYCGTNLLALHYSQSTVDHEQPLSNGGGNNIENLCISCLTCNQLKKHYSEKKFKEWVQEHKKAIQAFNTAFNSK